MDYSGNSTMCRGIQTVSDDKGLHKFLDFRDRLDYSLGQTQSKREEDMFTINAERSLLYLSMFFSKQAAVRTGFSENRVLSMCVC